MFRCTVYGVLKGGSVLCHTFQPSPPLPKLRYETVVTEAVKTCFRNLVINGHFEAKLPIFFGPENQLRSSAKSASKLHYDSAICKRPSEVAKMQKKTLQAAKLDDCIFLKSPSAKTEQMITKGLQ